MWGARKLGSAMAGFNIATAISKRGVQPHPILKRFFVISEQDGRILDITRETFGIGRRHGDQLLKEIADQGVKLVVSNKGKSVTARRGRGFIPLSSLDFL